MKEFMMEAFGHLQGSWIFSKCHPSSHTTFSLGEAINHHQCFIISGKLNHSYLWVANCV